MKKQIREKTGDMVERDYFEKVVQLLRGYKKQSVFLFEEIRTLSQKANSGETINGRLAGTIRDIEEDIIGLDSDCRILFPGGWEEDIPF